MPVVSWKTEGAITRLTLEQPEKLNALGEDAARDFSAAVRRVTREKSKVVILSGRGKAFCAGGDLGFIEKNRERPKAALQPIMKRFYASFLSIRDLPQVTIAQVHGAAVGAGLCLALACDLRAVSADAKLGFNFVRLGLNPGMAAWPLARGVFGDARARELLFVGRFFTGAQLHQWGGAALDVQESELGAETEKLAAEIAGHSRQSLSWLKKETRLDAPLAPYLALEARGQAECFKGADIAEGVAAIRARRAPEFR
jgi:enoyl-CoA hydratase/carnithine racemase